MDFKSCSLEGVVIVLLDFFKDKKVLITGHTGFKGSWLTKILMDAGAIVTGYALNPKTEPSLFSILKLHLNMNSVIADIRDYNRLKQVFDEFQPDIAIHMAAQPLVRESYVYPKETYEINVLGTIHFLECARLTPSVKSILNVTSDKVYQNDDSTHRFIETDILNGFDPYSNSKSCSELVTETYSRSYFKYSNQSVSTARAGNVIGGGDFSNDRIIPDIVRSILSGQELLLRNPNAIRPYQHVLEPLFAYLLIIKMQYENKDFEGAYNVGPSEEDSISTMDLTNAFMKVCGNKMKYQVDKGQGPHEAQYLKLDSTKIRLRMNWKPILSIREAIEMTSAWYLSYIQNQPTEKIMDDQIRLYIEKYNRLNSVKS